MNETNIIEETLEGSVDSFMKALEANFEELKDNIHRNYRFSENNLLMIKEICDQIMIKLAKKQE